MTIRGPIRLASRGFTLVEMLVALTIFSFIGVAAYQLLSSTGRLQESGEARLRALAGLQASLRQFDEDIAQFALREVPGKDGKPLPALVAGVDGAGVEFTRAGWRNPLGASRSGLQRVTWLLDDEHRLLRRYRRALDDADPDEIVERVMLEQVDEFGLRYLDDKGKWHDDWPLENSAAGLQPDANAGTAVAGAAAGAAKFRAPVAVELQLVHQQIGELSRVIPLR